MDHGVTNVARDRLFEKGQSRRIWAELYKVIDSSDVVIQVRSHRLSTEVSSLPYCIHTVWGVCLGNTPV